VRVASWVRIPGRGLASARRLLSWAGAYAGMTALMLAPAVHNGFPFIFADTGGYLARPFESTLALGRSALYGAFLAAAIPLDFWPNIVIQALACAWAMSLLLRAQGLDRPGIAASVTAVMCLATSMPWHADLLMPDVFLPLAVAALYLLAFVSPRLRTFEIAALIALVAFAIAAHMSIFAVALLLLALFAVVWAVGRAFIAPRPRLSLPAAAVAAGAALALATNYLIAGSVSFTPGGGAFLFARMLQDGFVKTHLDRNCPDAALTLCDYRDALPTIADDWLWGFGSPLQRLGGWQAFAPQARHIIIGSLTQQPGAQLRAAVTGTLTQLRAVTVGDGIDNTYNWHTEWALREYAPRVMGRFNVAAQQRGALDFRPLNVFQVPLALGATAALPILIVLGWRRRPLAAALGLTVFTALIGNAAVCAIFSGIVDRYQNRIVWLAVLAAALICYDERQQWRQAQRVFFSSADHESEDATRGRLLPPLPERSQD